MCRSMKRLQHIEKNTSSAEEDNWDYNKIKKHGQRKEKLLQRKTIGQRSTNQIHYRQWITSYTKHQLFIQ